MRLPGSLHSVDTGDAILGRHKDASEMPQVNPILILRGNEIMKLNAYHFEFGIDCIILETMRFNPLKLVSR